MGSYIIDTDLGKAVATNLGAGQSYKAKDGTTWTKDAKGNITVSKGGLVADAGNWGIKQTDTGSGISASDKAAINAAKQAYSSASDALGKQAAHDAAEVIRSGYGFSGGDDGESYIPLDNGMNKYAAMLQSMIDKQNEANRDAQERLLGMIDRYETTINNNRNSYAEALAAQKAANQAAVDRAVNSLNAQKEKTNTSYADMFRQLYLNRMKSQKNIDQQMALAGRTGGAAESTLLGLDTAYGDALRSGTQGRISALNELDRAIADAQLSGDIESAQATADSAINSANSYANALQSLIGNLGSVAQLQSSENERNRSYAYQLVMNLLGGGNMPSEDLLASAGISRDDAQSILNAAVANAADDRAANDRSYSYQLAMQMLSGGSMPSDELLASAGIGKADAQSILNSYSRSKVASTSSSGQRTTGLTKPTLTFSQTKELINDGVRSQQVLDAYEYYVGEPLTGSGDGSGDEEDYSNYELYNATHGSGAGETVEIPGRGDYTWAELEELQKQGKVKESVVTVNGKNYVQITWAK